MPHRTAFSLVELLVVLAIIVLLAGMLLPTVRQVKQSARSMQCLTNLRQIGYGMSGYAMEYDGVFPGWKFNNAQGVLIDWATWIAPYIEADPNGTASWGAAKGRILKCPNYPSWGINQSGTNAGYAINFWMERRLAQIKKTTATLIVSERTNDNGFASPKELDYSRHPSSGRAFSYTGSGDQYGDLAPIPIQQRVNGLFADMHVQPLDKAQAWTCLKWKVAGGDL